MKANLFIIPWRKCLVSRHSAAMCGSIPRCADPGVESTESARESDEESHDTETLMTYPVKLFIFSLRLSTSIHNCCKLAVERQRMAWKEGIFSTTAAHS